MITKITAAYTRTYSDTGQVKTYVEWVDDQGQHGRTEGNAECPGQSTHMWALLARATAEGVKHTTEHW